MARSHVGTSGWQYDHWRGVFYPEGLPHEEMLGHYARSFSIVEVNNTFYSLPEKKTVRKWERDTPKRFGFACKASRYLTHMKKLKDHGQGLRRFFSAIAPLADKLGPVLFQLPGKWNVDAPRLRSFLEALPPEHRYTFEFRDPSWFTGEVRGLLEEHGVALCAYDFAGRRSPVWVTAGFTYVRLHGPTEDAYEGSYDGRALYGWTRRILNWLDEGLDVYCFFDNDEGGHAPRNALRLMEMLDRHG